MKKTINILSFSLVLIAVLISCQPGGGNPKAVLQSFFELLAKEDVEGAAKLATKDSKSTMDMVKKGLDMAKKMDTVTKKEDPMAQFKDAVFGEPKITGDTAFVSVSSKANKQAPATFTLIKEEEKWKVDFTMNTLMKMGSKVNGPHGVEDQPQLTPEEMEHAQKATDSVLKNIDPKKLEELQKNMQNQQ